MAARTSHKMRPTGYYADPASPIASTPQRRRPTGFSSRARASRDALPSAPLSPMKKPNPARDMVGFGAGAGAGGKVEEEDSSGWRGAMFSPVFQPVAGEGSTGGSSRGKPSPSAVSHHATPPRKVAQCSLTSPGIYGAHTSKPVTRTPSPITTPLNMTAGGAAGAGAGRAEVMITSSTTSTVRAGGVTTTTASHREVHAVAYEDPAVASLAATDESWESEVSSEDMEAADGADMEDVEYDEFNPYLFMKLLPRYEEVAPTRRKIVLPKKRRDAPRISLVLDLDETLVHCSIQPIPDADLTFRVPFNGREYDVYVRKRPYLNHFLESVSRLFEVTVFTASQSVYAETLLNLIDPEKRLIRHRLFREACLNVDGNYLKDLTVLGRDLRTTILVDNSPHAFGYQVDNGIPIESWFEDPTDTELLKLLQFLKTVRGAKDVRTPIRKKFRVWDLINAAEAGPFM